METLLGLIVVFGPEVCSSLVVVVNGVLWLEFYGLVVRLDGLLVLLDLVVPGAEVAMVGGYSRFDFDGAFGQLDFLVVLLHLAECLAFQVVKIAGFVQLQPTIAAFTEFLPPFEMHEGIGLHEELFFGIGHC